MDLPDTLSLCSDEELLDRFRHGVTEAFGILLRRYQRELYGYLRRYLANDTLAEDVFQNTFLQVYLKCDQFETDRKVRPWLYTIATHQAIDALRRQNRHQAVSLEQAHGGENTPKMLESLESRQPEPVELVMEAETREQIRARVDKLPDRLRQVLILGYYQGLKYQEIADILDIPLGTVKSRLHAALHRLGEAWNAPTTSART